MANYCEDCGCRIYNGVCSNCNEELYIYENQYGFMEKPISKEFMEKVKDQRAKLDVKDYRDAGETNG